MADTKNENGYRNILKGTSLLGGVQFFQILVNLVRGKFVAMFLGPEGMGVSSLFSSASNTLVNFSSLGLGLASVREVAASKDDSSRLDQVRTVALTLIRFTALSGALVCALLSPWLSRWSFGSESYSWQFLLLSVAIFLTIAGNGKMALLQGLHKVKLLSVTSLAGATSGLVAGVPLYYFFGTKGIVPAMIILAITTWSFYTIGLRKALPKSRTRFERKLHMPMARRILSTGIILLSSSLVQALCVYIVNVFIRSNGDIGDVGLFNAANSITLQYASMVFAAMSLDYFPRLSAAANDRVKMRTVIDRQMEIVALMAAPLSILLVSTAPIIIRLLLTDQFLTVTPLMKWLGLSILIKAIATPLGYVTFAKDNRRLFFWLETVVCNLLYLGLSLLFYHLYGLMGLGYAAIIDNAVSLLLYIAVNRAVYGYLPGRRAATETLIALLLGVCGFCAAIVDADALSYWLLGSVLTTSAARSFLILKSRLSET